MKIEDVPGNKLLDHYRDCVRQDCTESTLAWHDEIMRRMASGHTVGTLDSLSADSKPFAGMSATEAIETIKAKKADVGISMKRLFKGIKFLDPSLCEPICTKHDSPEPLICPACVGIVSPTCNKHEMTLECPGCEADADRDARPDMVSAAVPPLCDLQVEMSTSCVEHGEAMICPTCASNAEKAMPIENRPRERLRATGLFMPSGDSVSWEDTL